MLDTSELIGQELGIEYGVSQTGYENVLERPAGLGGHLDIPIFSKLGLPVIEDIAFRHL